MKKIKITSILLCFALLLAATVGFGGCDTDHNASLLTPPDDLKVDFTELGNEEKVAVLQSDFAGALLSHAVAKDPDKNLLLSPLSVMLALSMTANGATNQTLDEMEAVLGGVPVEELNAILGAYLKKISLDEKLKIANSIWFRENLKVKEQFLATCSDYYGAEVYRSPFTQATVKEINDWVNKHTDGMIEEIVKEITPDNMMFLINALCFDAKWKDPYDPIKDVSTEPFYHENGTSDVDFMHSLEHQYIKTDTATGFIKDYEGDFSFVALLPNEGISVEDYLSMLSPYDLLDAIQNAEDRSVFASLPKFSYEFETEMSAILTEMGMPTAFLRNQATFGKMTGGTPELFISKVIHKTNISVDTGGTVAAAATSVTMDLYSASAEIMLDPPPHVVLNRPFVYMIIDNTTSIPLFAGVVTNP